MCGVWHVKITQQEAGCVDDGSSHEDIHHPHKQLCGHPHVYHILPFTLFPKVVVTKTESLASMIACFSHNFISEPNSQSHLRWKGLSCFSCRCYDEMLLHDENIKNNPKEHHGDICGEAGGSAALFTLTMSTSSLHTCIQQAEGCGNTLRGNHQLQPLSLTLWPTCMQFSLW